MSRKNKVLYYLDIAETVSEQSTCLKRNYGAVIVNNDEIISSGYNGAPRKMTSCLDCGTCNREFSERGNDYNQCKAVHAEMNAIISASRRDMLGSTLYLVGVENSTKSYVKDASPCSICKRLIINSGIEKVYVRKGILDYDLINPKLDWGEDDILGGY